MQEENDVLLRQIKSFAQGLGYMLGKAGGSPGNEIVFPQTDARVLPGQERLEQFLTVKQLPEATRFFFSQRYAMAEKDFMALGAWYFERLNALSDEALADANYSRQAVEAGLKQLALIQQEQG